MSNTYFKAMSVMGCEIGGITRRSLCRHNCCDGENCVTWLEKQFAKLNEYEEAKADGRMVVLPCKIGGKVWFLEKQLDIANGTCSTVISEYIVTEIRGNKYNPLWYMASSERCTHRDFHPTELGKIVFLTKEAAEKALGGKEE